MHKRGILTRFRRLEGFAIGAATAVLAVREVLPLEANRIVAFEFEVAFGYAESMGIEHMNEVVKYQCVDSAIHVFGTDGYKHKVDGVVFAVDGTQDVPPAEWEELAPGAAEGMRERGNGHSECNECAGRIDDDANAV